jgi:hypothetical protein
MATTGGGLIRPLLALVRSATSSSAKANGSNISADGGDALRMIAEQLVKSRASRSLVSLRVDDDDASLRMEVEVEAIIAQLPTNEAHELGYHIQRACEDLRGEDDPIAGKRIVRGYSLKLDSIQMSYLYLIFSCTKVSWTGTQSTWREPGQLYFEIVSLTLHIHAP